MPIISMFYGIIIKMFFDEHNPPHLHAIYGEYIGVISLNDFQMIKGDLPPKAVKLIQEWAKDNQKELLNIWVTKKFVKLPPLE